MQKQRGEFATASLRLRVSAVTLTLTLPRPFLLTASDQNLEAGTAWERGYGTVLHACTFRAFAGAWERG